ncbi:MAG: hypothetical protein M3O68_03295 [Thermoproteota archaeon]|jgi:hypothetical protein|nr:hypothetical protein [Thermoproteota archaeon]
MESKTHLCVCGHCREDHQNLLGTKQRYPCLKCPCPSFRKRVAVKDEIGWHKPPGQAPPIINPAIKIKARQMPEKREFKSLVEIVNRII